MTATLHFHTDPGEFLDAAGDHLAADPVVNTVVATVAHRMAARRAEGDEVPADDWWLVVRDASGAVVGAGMRTAPFPPRPPFLLPMPAEAAVALARVWHERGETVSAVNGALPAARDCAAEVARLGGGRVEVAQHTRLHKLDALVPPAPAPGALTVAGEDDVDLVEAWFGAFMADADEQAGRPRGTSAHEAPDRADLLHRIRGGRVWFWTDEAGRPVHLTAANPRLSVSPGWDRSTRHRSSAGGDGPVTRSRRSADCCGPTAQGCVSSPTRRTRRRTGSTPASASGRWSTWPTWWWSPDADQSARPSAASRCGSAITSTAAIRPPVTVNAGTSSWPGDCGPAPVSPDRPTGGTART